METIRLELLDKNQVVYVPVSSENEVTEIVIDMSSAYADFPEGSGEIWFKRADGETYLKDIEQEGGVLTAELTDVDTAISGIARVEGWWVDGAHLKKSPEYRLGIHQSFTTPDEIRSARAQALTLLAQCDELLATMTETRDATYEARDMALVARDEAMESAEHAAQSEQNADAAAQLASEYAENTASSAQDASMYATSAASSASPGPGGRRGSLRRGLLDHERRGGGLAVDADRRLPVELHGEALGLAVADRDDAGLGVLREGHPSARAPWRPPFW